MARPKIHTPEKVIEQLRAQADEEGYVTYSGTSGGLRAAAEREFGSWRAACEAAGVKARRAGRPSKKS